MTLRWSIVSSFTAMAALAMALAGCGGSGTVAMGAFDGDGSELTLLEQWQRFEDGAPTLRMTDAQVSEAWQSAARKSTHRVIRAGPASVGNDPGSADTVETCSAFPVAAEACSPSDCDLEPPPDSTWAFAPVLEHNGVPVAEFRSRFTDTSTLESKRGKMTGKPTSSIP
ncbi:MAG: hypothetical protein OXF33_06935 [Rhodospirillales bacterium]|nr:hypothetical protein [Rhodospirillales bacterium]